MFFVHLSDTELVHLLGEHCPVLSYDAFDQLTYDFLSDYCDSHIIDDCDPDLNTLQNLIIPQTVYNMINKNLSYLFL